MKNGLKNITAVSSCLCSNHRQMINFFQISITQGSKNYSPVLSNSLKKFGKLSVQFYQATFAFFLGGNCRYYPSCSHYAVECYEKHNFFYASYLTLKRLLSCHPFSRKSFYDPVPFHHIEREVHEPATK